MSKRVLYLLERELIVSPILITFVDRIIGIIYTTNSLRTKQYFIR